MRAETLFPRGVENCESAIQIYRRLIGYNLRGQALDLKQEALKLSTFLPEELKDLNIEKTDNGTVKHFIFVDSYEVSVAILGQNIVQISWAKIEGFEPINYILNIDSGIIRLRRYETESKSVSTDLKISRKHNNFGCEIKDGNRTLDTNLESTPDELEDTIITLQLFVDALEEFKNRKRATE